MEYVILWLGLAVAAGVIASSKNRSGFGYFILGLFLPLIGVLIALGVPTLNSRAPGDTGWIVCHACSRTRPTNSERCPHCGAGKPDPHAHEKKCPACAEWVLKEARKCKHCGEALEPLTPLAAGSTPQMGTCPGCGKLRASNVPKCVYCGDGSAITA